MPSLLSGSLLNTSSPTGYANIKNLQFQLGPTPSTSTGYTLIANSSSQITYVSSLGNLQFFSGTVYSNIPDRNIVFIGTGTGSVLVRGTQTNLSTSTGVLIVQGGIGISQGLYTGKDINVNGLTIGQGYQGVNNIVITAKANTLTNNSPDGENNIVLGYSALSGLSSAEKSIAIGRNALSSGTSIINTIAIGDGSLYASGTISQIPIGNISAISTGTATIVTVINHNITTGTTVVINNVIGTIPVNNITYTVKVITTNTFQLYQYGDVTFLFPISSTGTYTSGGIASHPVYATSNIAIGIDAGAKLINGQQNFFIGEQAGANFTSGSYNYFFGYDVATNMTNGNNNISINGKNMIDGVDNQINIGAVFYYNGAGYTVFNSDVGMGLGDDATDTTSTGALNLFGGLGVDGSVFVGNNLNVSGSGSITLTPVGTGTVTINPSTTGTMDNIIIGQTTPAGATFTNLVLQIGLVNSTVDAFNPTSGALVVQGGVGINKHLYVGQGITATVATITSTVAANSTTNGALTVAGGVGVQGSIYSADGNPQLNNLLYSPTVTVSPTPPSNPKVGQFWINSSNYAEYQWINDNGNQIWIQIAQL